MKVMVTGGKGFIGRRLVVKLAEQGNDVIVVDKELDGIVNFDYLREKLKGVEVVYHLGSASGSLFFSENPIQSVNVNCGGTANLLETIVHHSKVQQVVFAGTMSAYGFTTIPHHESGPVNSPNPYVATKLFGEQLMRLYYQNHLLPTMTTRFASVYGIGEHTKGPVANPVTQFVWSVLTGGKPMVFGNGTQTRDLVYVDDVCDALIAAQEHGKPGEIYNVSTNVETSLNDVIKVLEKVHGRKVEVEYTEWKPYDQQSKYIDRQCASYEKLNIVSGWVPKVGLEEGMRRVYQYYVENYDLIPKGWK